ncbi:DUF4245 domain-containing protein [Streptomyces celluloflavus]|uniref:DUF4245 domain-containing protein n=2 Tax=Streptomyces TaxID=1883 RepID=A0A4Q9HUZ3_STRKA|nr:MULTISPECIES: DUF4245 domain-containing protein [Streptomyces]MYU55029.1 DUF4245 family protein [Streptomyces sp. SID7805]TBO58685.1 DUF4245 domain-containing protein [Streptomyces kasugaensis]WSK14849.1 DUF4245 domain-containing protein [Streptomyces celluloflavus]
MGDDRCVAGTRGKQTVRDMILSLAAIGVVVAAVYFFIPHNDSPSAEQKAVQTVDYRVEVATARRAAPYPVAVPKGLPESWRATSVSYKASNDGKGGAWHLGMLDPEQEYAAIEQSDAPAAKFIKDVTLGAEKAEGKQAVGGAKWDRYKGEKYNALVREEPGVTTVVTGTAPYGRLAELAASLEAKKG